MLQNMRTKYKRRTAAEGWEGLLQLRARARA